MIPQDMSFIEWLTSMKGNLKVDGRPWTLEDRPALLPIYNEIPTYRADCFQRILVIQKSTQIGLTTMSTLAQLYLARKFGPTNIASFVPDLAGAQFLSTHRWLPVVRSCADIHRDLVSSGTSSEGSVMTRALKNPDGTMSLFRFLWTSGGMTTESFPASCTVLDEVQGMESADIDKVRARMGDSDMQFTMMLSTPNHSGLDINEWYLRGHQAVWHTRCSHCEALSDLSDEYCWICPVCQQWIPDPQRGEYMSQNPSADPKIRSFLLPRTIRRAVE